MNRFGNMAINLRKYIADNAQLKKAEVEVKKALEQANAELTSVKEASKASGKENASLRAELKMMKEKAAAARKTRPLLTCFACKATHLAPGMCQACVDVLGDDALDAA